MFSLFIGKIGSSPFGQLNKSLELATRHHFVAWEGISSMVLGSIFVAPEDGASGLAQSLAGYDKYTLQTGLPQTDTGLALNSTYYRAMLSRACEAAGDILSEARIHLDAGINIKAQTDEGWFEPELHRLKGELLLHYGSSDQEAQAEAALQGSL